MFRSAIFSAIVVSVSLALPASAGLIELYSIDFSDSSQWRATSRSRSNPIDPVAELGIFGTSNMNIVQEAVRDSSTNTNQLTVVGTPGNEYVEQQGNRSISFQHIWLGDLGGLASAGNPLGAFTLTVDYINDYNGTGTGNHQLWFRLRGGDDPLDGAVNATGWGWGGQIPGFDADDNAVDGNPGTPPTDGWVLGYQVTFEDTVGYNYYAVEASFRNANPPEPNVTLGLDNFKLEVIPEPATIALLSLGGLTLLRRRRA